MRCGRNAKGSREFERNSSTARFVVESIVAVADDARVDGVYDDVCVAVVVRSGASRLRWNCSE